MRKRFNRMFCDNVKQRSDGSVSKYYNYFAIHFDDQVNTVPMVLLQQLRVVAFR